jgi:altronate dehydratase small subunit
MTGETHSEADADDPRLLRLSPRDNVAPLKARARKGEVLLIGGGQVTLREDIATGHKIAVVPIAAGERIYKYGAPIGSATTAIEPGQLVHTHNMKSNYIPTYTQVNPALATQGQ